MTREEAAPDLPSLRTARNVRKTKGATKVQGGRCPRPLPHMLGQPDDRRQSSRSSSGAVSLSDRLREMREERYAKIKVTAPRRRRQP